VELAVVAEVPAGVPAEVPVGDGEAAAIMTGAMVPPGADAVVKVEDTEPGGAAAVRVFAAVDSGTSIRRRGEDVRAATVVLRAGDRLTPRRVALLAATGHGEVSVHRRPVVAVLSTGSELVEPGATLRPGQIHDSNSYMLAASVAAMGAVPVRSAAVEDDGPALSAALLALASEADLVVTSGGVSMGTFDVVKEAFGVVGEASASASAELGSISFVQVAMQPGKPQGIGVLGERAVPLLALPGNPVSSYVSFELFVRPAILTMMGAVSTQPVERGRISAPMRSPRGRRQIARAVVSRDPQGHLVADPVWGQASHFVADLARANALVIIPEEVTAVAVGDEVDILRLDPGVLDGSHD
jgi:molybdopterin molybdotransferase